MNTNFKLDGKVEQATTDRCKCNWCHSTTPYNKEETQMIVDFMGYEYYKDYKMYSVQIDHCDQEMSLEEMHFHRSWNWLMDVLKKVVAHGEEQDDWDIPTMVSEFDLDYVMYADFNKTYKSVITMLHYFKTLEKGKEETKQQAVQFFQNLTLKSGSYYLSDYVEEYAEMLSEEEGMALLSERNELRKECQRKGIDFHQISCDVCTDFMNGVSKVWQKEFDRQVFIFRVEGKIVGLNFYQGKEIGDESDYSKPCPYLTEIFNRLYQKYDTDEKRINEAMELYYIAFVLQDEVLDPTFVRGDGGEDLQSFSLIKSHIDILKKGLKCLRKTNSKKIDKIGTDNQEVDTLHSENFDSIGLTAMLQASTFVNIELTNDCVDNWSASEHGVDFPSPYCDENY